MIRYHEGREYTVTQEGLLQKGDWTGYRELSPNVLEMVNIVMGEPHKMIIAAPTFQSVLDHYGTVRAIRRTSA